MALRSRLFAGNKELQACLIDDRAHMTPSSRGEHVKLVQRALILLGYTSIAGSEYVDGLYGNTTSEAVLRYKRGRNIVNRSYQTSPDNIVGKMTIKSLDDEVIVAQDRPYNPLFIRASPSR